MDVDELLEKYTPSQIERMFESACPLYRPAESTFSGVYLAVHELANNILAVKLQESLGQVEVATEQELSEVNGRVDIRVSTKNGKLSVMNSHRQLAVIELKTGTLKLVQPAIYAYVEGVDVLLAGIKTCEVQVVPLVVAEGLLRTVAEHIELKERLRERNTPIPGTCKRCANPDCGYAMGQALRLNEREDVYEEKVRLLENLDFLAGKIATHILAKLDVEVLKQEVPAEA